MSEELSISEKALQHLAAAFNAGVEGCAASKRSQTQIPSGKVTKNSLSEIHR